MRGGGGFKRWRVGLLLLSICAVSTSTCAVMVNGEDPPSWTDTTQQRAIPHEPAPAPAPNHPLPETQEQRPSDETQEPQAATAFSPEGGFASLPTYAEGLNEANAAAAELVWLSGLASWYSHKFHGRRTASGEPYLRHGWTAAHREWPLGSRIAIRNPSNGVEVTAKVNDRGPFHPNRLVDVSFAVAKALGIVQQGVATVEVRLLSDSDVVSMDLNDAPPNPAHTASRPTLKPPVQWPLKTK